jgi:dihydroorotase
MVPTPAWIHDSRAPFDLLVRAGRVVCRATGLDGPGAVGIVGDRIVAAGPRVDGLAREELRLPDALLLPGLVDLHAHPARGESRYGIDPDLHLLPFGTTTVLAQGEAGALNLARYHDVVIARSRTRIRLAINLSRRGEATPGGCFEAWDDVDAAACVRAVRETGPNGGRAIWGIAVNISRNTCGRTDPRAVLAEGLRAAGETGLPLLFGPRRDDDWALREQLALLRPGDVLTYCFVARPRDHGRPGAGRHRGAGRAGQRRRDGEADRRGRAPRGRPRDADDPGRRAGHDDTLPAWWPSLKSSGSSGT